MKRVSVTRASVTAPSLTVRYATRRSSACSGHSTAVRDPPWHQREVERCTQGGIPWCICPGSMTTMVPGRVCTGIPLLTHTQGGYIPGIYPVIHTQGGYLPVYTPYIHPGRLPTRIYHSIYTPGRLYTRVYLPYIHQGGYIPGLPTIYTPGRLYTRA